MFEIVNAYIQYIIIIQSKLYINDVIIFSGFPKQLLFLSQIILPLQSFTVLYAPRLHNKIPSEIIQLINKNTLMKTLTFCISGIKEIDTLEL